MVPPSFFCCTSSSVDQIMPCSLVPCTQTYCTSVSCSAAAQLDSVCIGGAGGDGRTYIGAAAAAQLESAPHISDCWFDSVVLELSAVVCFCLSVFRNAGSCGPRGRRAAASIGLPCPALLRHRLQQLDLGIHHGLWGRSRRLDIEA